MWPPPLFVSRPRPVQALLGVVVPTLGGVVGGVLLGVSEPAYLIYSVLAVAAGYLGGYEHRGAGGGALRGVTGGLLFGGFILIAHEVTGSEAKADLPHPAILLVILTTALGAGLGALGGRSRAKRRD